MRNSHSSLRNNSVCVMCYDFPGCVLYSLIWVPQFKSPSCYLGCRGNKTRRRLSMSEGNARSSAVVSLKIITPSAYQSWERGGIIYRDINSLRQSVEFYNLSVIGCIVPSAKATEFHVIKIKKRVQEYAFNYHFSCNNLSCGIYICHQEGGKLEDVP